MNKIFVLSKSFVSRFRKDEKGTQLVETAIWLAVISAAAVTAIGTMGPSITTIMTRISGAID